MKTLHTLFFSELSDMYDAEQQIAKALPKMAESASSEKLRITFWDHLEQTEGHVTKIEQVFALFHENAKAKSSGVTVGLLAAAEAVVKEFKGSSAIDAALISAAQKVEHHEIATYGCLHHWALLLDNTEAADLLEQILEEERGTDKKLSFLATTAGNREALVDVH